MDVIPMKTDVEAMFQEFIPLQLACLADYADLIPGTLEAVADFRGRGLKIGSTTGYLREMMELLLKEATDRGYTPDTTVCASDVPEGRPEPWMCLQNAMNLGNLSDGSDRQSGRYPPRHRRGTQRRHVGPSVSPKPAMKSDSTKRKSQRSLKMWGKPS